MIVCAPGEPANQSVRRRLSTRGGAAARIADWHGQKLPCDAHGRLLIDPPIVTRVWLATGYQATISNYIETPAGRKVWLRLISGDLMLLPAGALRHATLDHPGGRSAAQ